MRHFIVGMVAVSVTLLVAAQASAYTAKLTQDTASIAVNGDIVLTAFMDNTGDPGLTFVAFSFMFDTSAFGYTSESVKNNRLQKSHNENAYLTSPSHAPLTKNSTQFFPGEVAVSWAQLSGNWHENSNLIMAVATFTSTGATGFFPFKIVGGTGGTFGQLQGTYASPGISFPNQIDSVIFLGNGGVYVPEPSAASLSLAAVVTLYLLRSRQRRRSLP